MNNASAKEELLEIPDKALVACPLVQFALQSVAECPDCKFFVGLEDRFPGSQIEFAKRYTVKCLGEPVRRPVMMLAKD